MKLATQILSVMVMGLLISTSLLAKDGAAGDKPKATGIKGAITKIEGKSVTIAAQKEGGGGDEVTITVDDKTRIMIDGQASELSKLKVGDNVRAAYNDTKVALYIASGVAKRGGGK